MCKKQAYCAIYKNRPHCGCRLRRRGVQRVGKVRGVVCRAYHVRAQRVRVGCELAADVGAVNGICKRSEAVRPAHGVGDQKLRHGRIQRRNGGEVRVRGVKIGKDAVLPRGVARPVAQQIHKLRDVLVYIVKRGCEVLLHGGRGVIYCACGVADAARDAASVGEDLLRVVYRHRDDVKKVLRLSGQRLHRLQKRAELIELIARVVH